VSAQLTAGDCPVECCVHCLHDCCAPGVGPVVGHIDGALVGRQLSLAGLTSQRNNADGCTCEREGGGKVYAGQGCGQVEPGSWYIMALPVQLAAEVDRGSCRGCPAENTKLWQLSCCG
jgi:hypothetical protein